MRARSAHARVDPRWSVQHRGGLDQPSHFRILAVENAQRIAIRGGGGCPRRARCSCAPRYSSRGARGMQHTRSSGVPSELMVRRTRVSSQAARHSRALSAISSASTSGPAKPSASTSSLVRTGDNAPAAVARDGTSDPAHHSLCRPTAQQARWRSPRARRRPWPPAAASGCRRRGRWKVYISFSTMSVNSPIERLNSSVCSSDRHTQLLHSRRQAKPAVGRR
jgi:hypothetical protein